jgi:hypothetical protein
VESQAMSEDLLVEKNFFINILNKYREKKLSPYFEDFCELQIRNQASLHAEDHPELH